MPERPGRLPRRRKELAAMIGDVSCENAGEFARGRRGAVLNLPGKTAGGNIRLNTGKSNSLRYCAELRGQTSEKVQVIHRKDF